MFFRIRQEVIKGCAIRYFNVSGEKLTLHSFRYKKNMTIVLPKRQAEGNSFRLILISGRNNGSNP